MSSWHENGQLSEKGEYEYGQKHGTWTAWDQQGNKLKQAQFDKGQILSEKIFNAAEPTDPAKGSLE